QGQDYKNKAQASTFYPSIYRGENLSQRELNIKFDILNNAVYLLKESFRNGAVDGYKEVLRKRYIQWSIIQHYEVCPTPLLDFTHSIRVACSFAQRNHKHSEQGYVFVFGLPYITNRISINSEYDIINVRLLSICPPDALRPYFQDGYLAGTADITYEYESKTELDFRNRLISKFEIPNSTKFWGRGFSMLPDSILFPKSDRIESLCKSINPAPTSKFGPTEIGAFITEWTHLEAFLVGRARNAEPQATSLSMKASIDVLRRHQVITQNLAKELHSLRLFRNEVVHRGHGLDAHLIAQYTERVRNARKSL
ncbi:MAG: FRG domain-containing protein, partial [Deltaproteobacteria bacterium]|nr:FRG domain-containing protein [Deltaproteobacteria bacterium]